MHEFVDEYLGKFVNLIEEQYTRKSTLDCFFDTGISLLVLRFIIDATNLRSCVVALVIILFGVLVAPKCFPKLPFMMDNAATTTSASDFLGLSSAILTVVSYGAPLEVMGKVRVYELLRIEYQMTIYELSRLSHLARWNLCLCL